MLDEESANYLSVGQMYLRNNPLLKTPLTNNDVKIYPIGHWGTVPGQNFIYAHLNRIINKYDLNMFFISGPGHGGQVIASKYISRWFIYWIISTCNQRH
nr:hypothetical protein [Mycoplasmopsis bovis]